jgi:hypothetical protein
MKKNEIPTQGDHGKISLPLLILLFITSFITTSKGQNVNSIPLDKLIEESLEKDPRLQAAQTTSNLFLAEKSKAYQFGDIQLGYSHGEINAPVQDEQWGITVDLGNILGINKRINAAESKAMVQQQRINILRKQRILKIKDQWNKCILLLRKQKRLETRISEAEKALEIIESCETNENFNVAEKYISFYREKFNDFVGYRELEEKIRKIKVELFEPKNLN